MRHSFATFVLVLCGILRSMEAPAEVPTSLDTPTLRLRLPDGGLVFAHRTHLEQSAQAATWIGDVDGVEHSEVVVTNRAGSIAGFARLGTSTYDVHGDPTSDMLRLESNGELDPEAHEAAAMRSPGAAKSVTEVHAVMDLAATFPSAAHVPVVHDLLVLYTDASARRHGVGPLEARVTAAVAATNHAYRNSGVGITLRMVALQRASTIVEAPSGMIDTLERLAGAREARQARDRSGADLVVLVNENQDWCGYAYILFESSLAYREQAYAAVRSGCLAQDFLAHEIGHLQGLVHDRASAPSPGALPFGHGYRRCERGGFRDIMAYPCPSLDVPRLRSFSSPDRQYHGMPTGIAHALDAANSADAARALNETAALVASYREPVAIDAGQIPRRPGMLTAEPRNGTVRLRWPRRDDASGTIVERSTSAAAFIEIARLDANTTLFRDRTAARGVVYTYRLKAVNGIGTSEASNAVVVAAGKPSPAADRRLLPRRER